METLRFNDGDMLARSSATLSGQLFLYMNGYSLKAVFDILIEPENTERIVYTRINGEEVVFEGFRRLIAVRDEGNGLITAVLQKEAE